MPKHPPLSHDAAAFARQAERDLATLRKALRQAEDNLAGLHRMLKVPTPKGGRRTIKGARTSPALLAQFGAADLGNFAANALTSGTASLDSFYPSNAQIYALTLASLRRGQRIL